jgi:hypothetical protein
LNALAPPLSSALPYSSSRILRSSRVSDCSEVRIWSNWTGTEVCWIGSVRCPQLGRPGRAGFEVHEEVALEEDARADLRARVLVNRAARLADAHRHRHGQLAGGGALDLHHLADLDAAIRTGEPS